MATPSSSATSPSPPMSYFLHNPAPPSQTTVSPSADSLEREKRQKAIKKFLARAEVSMVTRALRTRLSYASYKATHNIHHVTLRDLEARTQTHSQAASFSRTIAAKRKAVGTSNYYNNHTSQGTYGSGVGVGISRRSGSATMPPPAAVSPPRTYSSAVNGNAYATPGNLDTSSSPRNLDPSQTLYASILAPPPTQPARTIHNARDPPVPAPSRPQASVRMRTPTQVPRGAGEATRSYAKNKKPGGMSSSPSPNRRKAKRNSTEKGKYKQSSVDIDVDRDGDVDMKAAATLTSLLLHHRPSITGSTSSPRSSVDGSDAGSAYSYPHFQQSSARTIATASPPAAASTSNTIDSPFRAQTPPASTGVSTPRPGPTDNEAASLMLFLATSPSPARPTNKDSRDSATYRALGGGSGILRDKGRVLFASSGTEPSGSGEAVKALSLDRNEDVSFTSSISSIGTQMDAGSEPESGSIPAPSQLLPPPSLPSRMLESSSPPSQRDVNNSPRLAPNQVTVEFNFNDFIHASPSPLRGTTGQGSRANLSLRADIGRKLFEEEQMRNALNVVQSPGQRLEEPSLRAGIDLVQT